MSAFLTKILFSGNEVENRPYLHRSRGEYEAKTYKRAPQVCSAFTFVLMIYFSSK
jgi:hypothetical protein